MELLQLPNEIWKDIKGYEGEYLISNFGRVKSLKRAAPRILKQRVGSTGYMMINLNQKTFQVHRLVADAFVLNTEDKPTVDHIDGDKTNNKAENLRWADKKQQAINKCSPKGANCYYPVVCIEEEKEFKDSNSAAAWIMEIGNSLASRKGIISERIRKACEIQTKTAFGYHWKFKTKEAEINE